MEPQVKKAIMIASIVIVTIMLIKHITNSPVSYGTTSSKTVVVHHRNEPVHRYYYGFNEPVHHYNPYKAQYYN
jgi:hypothetical protein